MPCKTIWEPQGLLTEWWGNATNAEMVAMQEQVHRHPLFDATVRYSIHDFSRCDSFSPSQPEVEYSAAIDGAASKSSKKLKIAIVAANAGVTVMVHQYMALGLSPYPVKFFATLADARAWVT
ncbi:MAG: hypothetical protein RIQ60_4292 [Pseudomonadota bacterium]|jgi:hypothetical protein